jgi:hypothetical protein
MWFYYIVLKYQFLKILYSILELSESLNHKQQQAKKLF